MTASPGPRICAKTRARETPGGPSGVAEAPTECFVGGVRPGCVGGREQGVPVKEQCRSSGSSLTQQMLSSCCEDARLVGSPFVCGGGVWGGGGGGPRGGGGGGETGYALCCHPPQRGLQYIGADSGGYSIRLCMSLSGLRLRCARPFVLCRRSRGGAEQHSVFLCRSPFTSTSTSALMRLLCFFLPPF